MRLVVNEFGVYKPYTPPESRARWISDMQAALSKYGLGWAMWDYQAGFDLVVGRPGRRAVDPLLVPALRSTIHLDGEAALPPLTPDDLIDLSARPSLLDEYVRKYKIAFLPAKQDVAYLSENGVPRAVTSELKRNFASRITYRVCRFTTADPQDSSFTETLTKQFETAKLEWKHSENLFFTNAFDPVPCGAAGPGRADLNRHPHVGYVLVMGAIDRNPQNPAKRNITAHLVFASREQPATEIVPPLIFRAHAPADSSKDAQRIESWSVKQVKDQLR